jgi:hypothetical protein
MTIILTSTTAGIEHYQRAPLEKDGGLSAIRLRLGLQGSEVPLGPHLVKKWKRE